MTSIRRTLAALALAPLLGSVALAAPASAHEQGGHDEHDGHHLGWWWWNQQPAPQQRTIVQGVATDSSGHGIDNVTVEALDSKGAIVATSLTYASPRAKGPQHGYFFLEVDPGVYDVALLRKGYDAGFISDVNVTGKHAVSLGPIEMLLRDWPTATNASVADPVVGLRQAVKVSVAVSSSHTKVSGGRVVVKEGRRKLASVPLKRSDKGLATVNVGRLPQGKHLLTATYTGAEGQKASTSHTMKVVVARTAHRPAPSGRSLPDAW